MNYTVIWRHALLPFLARFFNSARERGLDPNAITRAVAEIDRLLEEWPETTGESRVGAIRVLTVNPLTVFFEVYPDERVVFVLTVRYSHHRT